MAKALVVIMILALLVALPSAQAKAKESLALDKYTCAQFLRDTTRPGNGTKLLKSLMMISWATGYASGFQKNSTRADAAAFVLMASTLGTACRNNPSKLAVTVIVNAIRRFVGRRG